MPARRLDSDRSRLARDRDLSLGHAPHHQHLGSRLHSQGRLAGTPVWIVCRTHEQLAALRAETHQQELNGPDSQESYKVDLPAYEEQAFEARSGRSAAHVPESDLLIIGQDEGTGTEHKKEAEA